LLEAIQAAAGNQDDDQTRRRELHGQVDRLKDLYVMGDRSKDQYVIRREADALLDDFARFWEAEDKPAERHKLLGQLFDRI